MGGAARERCLLPIAVMMMITVVDMVPNPCCVQCIASGAGANIWVQVVVPSWRLPPITALRARNFCRVQWCASNVRAPRLFRTGMPTRCRNFGLSLACASTEFVTPALQDKQMALRAHQQRMIISAERQVPAAKTAVSQPISQPPAVSKELVPPPPYLMN